MRSPHVANSGPERLNRATGADSTAADGVGAEASSVERAVADIAAGRMVIVIDSTSRENEGDVVVAAEMVTPEIVNFMAQQARGLICAPMKAPRLAALGIQPMTPRNTDVRHTAFHVSVDVRQGTTTGISASDRARTIRALASPRSIASDFVQPGHVFPLAYQEGGVLRRAGHTEASVDLCQMAGLGETAVICEIANPDGEMARLPDLLAFAAQHDLCIVSIDELISYRRRTEVLVQRTSEARIPTRHGDFTGVGFRDLIDGREHIALTYGDIHDCAGVLVRMHSECLTGDVFGSLRCDCGAQLDAALAVIAEEGRGAVVYLRGQEGRGIGLLEKLKAYALQDKGFDTVDANLELGHPADRRDYGTGMQILMNLGLDDIRLLTNNPAKRAGLEGYGILVRERVPLQVAPTTENATYLRAKHAKLGHMLSGC